MANNVYFNEEQEYNASTKPVAARRGFAEALVRAGIAKNTTIANAILVLIALFAFIAALVIVAQSTATPPPNSQIPLGAPITK